MQYKLFLTSAGLPSETRKYFIDLLSKKPDENMVGFIPTAADPEKNKSFVIKAKDEIINIGMKLREIDLKKETRDTLERKLSRCDVIYVNGGNTFYLLKCIRKCGFDIVLTKLLDLGKIYVGVSAGSYVICPTIEMATWKHQDRDRFGLKDFTALNIVNFLITAHFSEKYQKIINSAVRKTSYPIVALNDKQAIVVRGGHVKIVGSGEKVFFNGFKES